MDGFGLVLGGGGAKGAYEIGVWKALRELDVPIKAVTGTSVGALNGAIIVQGDFDVAYELWTTISIENVINVEKEIVAAGEGGRKTIPIINTIKNLITNGGLDVSPLKEMLNKVIDEDKIRRSPIDLGIVTFSLTDFKPVEVFKDEIPEGKLVDYLLASACFPAFKPHEIDNKKFIDGGIYDNIPLSLMLKKDIKNIITVDISGVGFVKRVNKRGINIIEIKNSEDLGGTLEFDGERSKENIELGYLDTLRVFGKLKGHKYYFIPNKEFDEGKEFIKSLDINYLKRMYAFLGLDIGVRKSAANKIILDKIIRTIQQYSNGKLSLEGVFPAMLEIAAEQLGIERKRVYTLKELSERILEEYNKIIESENYKENMPWINRLLLARTQLEFDKELLKNAFDKKYLISYDANIEEKDEKVKRMRRFIAMAFPKIVISNMLIALLLERENVQREKAVD
ncbi:patatin-like phospholipase family protein [Caloramator australicus]|uniref:Ferredoxin reductase n=1 Tax=Caloramator australicus RC3 TaxID=857293 RepID=I7LJQ6_9CLOT|nr:patatin-like phospholipase family protein [Caloramator australicus]CCJ33858.1 Ferredoxin reductase [Caloramator australicus RC3]